MTLLAAVFCLTGARAQQALPYDYGFEDGNITLDGWTTANIAGYTGLFSGGNNPYEGSYAFGFWYSTNPPQYLISPELTGTGNGVEVSFYYKARSGSYPETFCVGYSTTTNDVGAFTFSPEVTCTATSYGEPYDEVFPAGTKYIAVKYTAYDMWTLYLDGFSFTVPPACKMPSNLTVSNVTNESAVISWTSDATNFDIEVNGEVTENVTSPYALTSLDAVTAYEVRVRTNCGGGEVSDWTSAISFTTAACANPVTVNYSLTDSYGDGWNGNAINVIDENENVVAMLTITTGSSASGTLTICGTYARFEWVAGAYASETSWTFTDEKGVTLFSGKGATSLATGNVLYEIDNSDCAKPKNLTVSDITYSSVTLTWEGESAEGWVIGYVADDPMEEYELVEGITENTYTITGLDPETLYYVAVRPSCAISK